MSGLTITASLGASVRGRRFRLGISQEELAERAGLHRTYIAGIERGARNITVKSAEKLAQALGTSIASLFGESEKTPASHVASLLLVEDDPRDIELTLEAFRQARLTNDIRVARDGAAALEMLFATGAYAERPLPIPQIVLLDLNLPKLHGLEVLRRIKSDKRTAAIHVIVLTISHQNRDFEQALRLGAAAYLVKPVDFENFCKLTPRLSFDWTLFHSSVNGGMF